MSRAIKYTGEEIIEMIKEAPDIDYVGEYLIGRILGDEPFEDNVKEIEEISGTHSTAKAKGDKE